MPDDDFRPPSAVWLRPMASNARSGGHDGAAVDTNLPVPATPAPEQPAAKMSVTKSSGATKKPSAPKPPIPKTPPSTRTGSATTTSQSNSNAGKWLAAVAIVVFLILILAAVVASTHTASESNSAEPASSSATAEIWRTASIGSCLSLTNDFTGDWPLPVLSAAIVECGTPGTTHRSVGPVENPTDAAGCDGIEHTAELSFSGPVGEVCLVRVYEVGQCAPASPPDAEGKRSYYLAQVIPCDSAAEVVSDDGVAYRAARITAVGLDSFTGCEVGEARFRADATSYLCAIPPG